MTLFTSQRQRSVVVGAMRFGKAGHADEAHRRTPIDARNLAPPARGSGKRLLVLLLLSILRQLGDVLLVLGDGGGEDVAARSVGDEIEIVRLFRIEHRGDGILAGIADRRRRAGP